MDTLPKEDLYWYPSTVTSTHNEQSNFHIRLGVSGGMLKNMPWKQSKIFLKPSLAQTVFTCKFERDLECRRTVLRCCQEQNRNPGSNNKDGMRCVNFPVSAVFVKKSEDEFRFTQYVLNWNFLSHYSRK